MTYKCLMFMTCLQLMFVNAQSFENRIDVIRPDAPELAAFGVFDIGVQTIKLINPDQLDIVNATDGIIPSYDRPLTLEVWYPATLEEGQAPGGEYAVVARDPTLTVTLRGTAVRDAAVNLAQGPYPLIIISHGYPGNRFLLSHLGENLASKGYVAVSIDHTDSTYSDQAAFGSTLLNRPLDQLFVLNEIARLSQRESSHFLAGLVNTDNTGIIGYSMGGYGVVNVVGGGFTEASVGYSWGTPGGALAIRQAGNETYMNSMDERVKAAMAFGPWGMNRAFWDAEGLAGIKTPIMFVAGSVDDISGYEEGTKAIYDLSVNAARYLLTFENANHNAGAPMPAPVETWQPSEVLPFTPFEHYSDPVWDTRRMNNIAQHFTTAFFGHYLKQDDTMLDYLDLVENAADGIWSVDDKGNLNDDHTYWKGFSERMAAGLSLRQAGPE